MEMTLHIDQYYTASDAFRRRFDAVGRRLALDTGDRERYAAWKTRARAELSALLGLPTMERCDPSPQVVERAPMDGYLREKVLLQTEPGVRMPLYALIPDGLAPGERRPAVIAAHGHCGAGKFAVAGRADIPAVKAQIDQYNYAYGVALVKEGFVVFCPDARGFGERRELAAQGDDERLFLNGSCMVLNHMALPLGQTVTGMWTWDLMRLADYIAARPECDPARLGCVGLSGGGLQTLWLAALDDRVQCAVVSGYFYGYRQSLLDIPYNCSCNYVPHLWEAVDMGDLGALIAPRPLLIETGDADPLNGRDGTANVESQVAVTRRAYTLLAAEDALHHHVFPGAHRWCGERALPWMKRWLTGGDTRH